MSELLKINVNDHTERKNGLTYLSWAWAWAEVLKLDANARWYAEEYSNERGCAMPCMFMPDGSAMVKVVVTIKGETKTCLLPVMNHKNQAIKNPDAFAVNTAIMRCLAKAISMHGLGLYIYAGEDLPEGEEKPEEQPRVVSASFRSSPTMTADGRKAIEELPREQQEYLKELAMDLTELATKGGDLHERLALENLDNEQKLGLWSILDSKTRAAIKKSEQAAQKVAA